MRRADRLAGQRIRVGDAVTVDARTGLALDLIPLNEVQDVVLEEVPDVSYEDIGGLADQIDQIRDSIELPFLHPGLYREHGLKAPKGILLYGPPGTGKTLIAKAVASSLAARSTEEHRSYFLNIKGPELLNKYVGETERHIRTIFARAREKASDGYPVVVFFDEMESLFRTRGSGVSSDVETTIVPQLLAETEYLEVTYVDGSTRILHFADFTSGAVIANIVDRAKKHAIKDYLSAKTAPSTADSAEASKGLRTEHLLQAIGEEFAEQEDLPNHASPEEWARISGHRGGRVAGLRMLLHQESR